MPRPGALSTICVDSYGNHSHLALPGAHCGLLVMKGVAVAHRGIFLPSLRRLHPLGPSQGPPPLVQVDDSHLRAHECPCSPPLLRHPFTARKVLGHMAAQRRVAHGGFAGLKASPKPWMSTLPDFLISSLTSFRDANMIKFFTQFISIMLEIQ